MAETGDARKAAIVVANRADKSLDDKLGTFEDFITSHITEKGFTVISREVATDALSSLKKDSKVTDADQLLSDNSSVLRLGQLLGVDYLILASISSYGSDKRATDAYGEKTVNVIHNLRVTYKILDATHGGTLASDTIKTSKTIRYSDTASEVDSDLINGLLDDAGEQVAASVGKKDIKVVSLSKDQVEFSIACGMQDLALTDGQKLKVALQMTEAGYQRWKDNTAFLAALENNRKLTDAEAEKVRGIAQMFRQSGYKVDVKSDVKVDVKRRTIF